MPAQAYLTAKDQVREQHESMDHYSRGVFDAGVDSTKDPVTGLVDLRKLRTASGRDAYEKALIKKGVKVADILAKSTGTGAISFNPSNNNFDKARALLTIGLKLDKVHNTIEQLGETATGSAMDRAFYRDIEEVKNILGYGASLALNMSNPNEVPGVISYIDSGGRQGSSAGVNVDPAKVESKDDLVAILDEFDDKGVLTPEWKKQMIRAKKNIFR